MWNRTGKVRLMISLSPDEHILLADEAKYHGTRGKLYLTNKRLVFEYEKRGIIFKGKYIAVNLPLERISGVSIVGVGFIKKLSINTIRNQASFGIPRYEFSVKHPETWKAKIEVARMTPTITSQREVKEIIKEIVKIKCPYCGMLVEHTFARCPNCGGIIK
jgi:predicted RNA-binding Zn-ribbon protein involved in translation (DUF1610 family)